MTQAPHCEVSQPIWVPVRSSVSRRNSDRSSEGGISAFTFLPLTKISTFMRFSPVACCERLACSGQQPRFVSFPSRDHHVSDGQRVTVEHPVRHIGDQLVVADDVQNDLDEVTLIFDGANPA